MPKQGTKTERRSALVTATIREVGARGSLDVTVGQIARRAGVSSALAHHYFGTKENILLSAMRHILRTYGAEVRASLTQARTPRGRLDAVVRASFAPTNFQPHVISAWLMFYVHAQTVPEAARLLAIYKARLASNLIHDLKPLVGVRAPHVASGIGALIDGLYIRHGLQSLDHDAEAAARVVLEYLDMTLEQK
jgi:TetR/AcrR family transcriptional repressor of bet genes